MAFSRKLKKKKKKKKKKTYQIFYFKWKVHVFVLQGIMTCPKAPI